MEMTQEKIYEEIGEIRETIEFSKRKFTGPYKLFFGYGGLQGILFIINLIGSFVFKIGNGNAYFNFVLEMLISIIIVILYLAIYKSEKITSNRYYLIAISTWGILIAALPFLLFGARLVIMLWAKESALEALQVLMDYKMMASMMLACVAAITTGYIIDKRQVSFFAVLILFCFICTRVLSGASFTIFVNANTEIVLELSMIIYYVINIIGYIVLGILIKCQEKKSGNI